MLRLPPYATASDQVRRHELPGPAEPRLVVLERAVVPPGGRLTRLAVAADARLVDEPVAAFARTMTLSLAVLAAALLAAAVVQVEVGLRPLARLRRDLAAVHGRYVSGAIDASTHRRADPRHEATRTRRSGRNRRRRERDRRARSGSSPG